MKRNQIELIRELYDYIAKNGGEIYLSKLREVTSNPTHLLELIKEIQDRPYLYFKTYPEHIVPGQRQYTILKLSSHKRNPNTRYLQIEEVIDFLEREYEKISLKKEFTKAEIVALLTRILDILKMMANRVKVPNSYFV